MSEKYTIVYAVRMQPITISTMPRIMTFGSGFMSGGYFINAAHFLPNSGPYHSQPKTKLATTATRTAIQFTCICGCMTPPFGKNPRSHLEQVLPDYDRPAVVLAHALGPHRVGDRGIVARHEMREHQGL